MAEAFTAVFQRLTTSADAADRKAAATEAVAILKAGFPASVKSFGVVDKLKAAFEDKTSPAAREGAALLYTALTPSRAAEPYLVPLLPFLLDLASDKSVEVRDAAVAAANALLEAFATNATKTVLPMLFDGLQFKKVWQTKALALNLIAKLAALAPKQVAASMGDIVAPLSESVADAKEQVKTAALASIAAVFAVNGNRDIEGFMPSIIGCIAKPTDVPDCIHKLGATTFVQQVESPCLAIIVPLLVKGLRERQTAIKRKSAVIIDNMAKLVEEPADAAPFLPKLLPELEKVKETVPDPECRSVCERAYGTLVRVGKAKEGEAEVEVKKADVAVVLAALKAQIGGKAEVEESVLAYLSQLGSNMINSKNFELEEWHATMVPFLTLYLTEADAAAITKAYLAKVYEDTQGSKASFLEEDEGEDLCNCEFTLAYGAKILLSNTRLWLKRGRRYGLCGGNGCGKSTLMRAIANGQVEGFPPKDVLRTVYVEHDIDASLAETAVLDFVAESEAFKVLPVVPTRAEVEAMLASVGFTKEMLGAAVTALSGGWKMKLALARAILLKADILLLDEPTNHLDVTNVAWLEKYLISLTNVTSLIVSHDSGFLDHVCTDIVHYEGRKLRRYKGNLAEFVKKVPEAKSYYSLAEAAFKFTFPEPGFLEGVKTKDRAILKMHGAGFQYPGSNRKQLQGVTVNCTLSSRVACIGPNGAGKSTLIKLLTGELEPQDGTVWKHPNLRVAYVAQHAFHHIEQHLDKSPNQYIQWRYASGEDREEAGKVSRVLTEEEEKALSKIHVIDGKKLQVDKILSRRKLKKSYEYDVQWVGMGPDQSTWLPRDKLEEMGMSKMINEIDAKEAARMGLVSRPLTQAIIEKHLADFGLEAEFASHSHMRGLSGGQKVKVVLGAAMWNNPHMVVLDEPTNYLDRDSLGALAGAIKEFGGGVIIISHNSEFTSGVCTETWNVAEGRCQVVGASGGAAEKVELKIQEEMIDAYGNTIKIKAPGKEKLSRKEQKAKAKLRQARIERGEEVSDEEEDS